MKLALNSELWATIYFNLREEFYMLYGHAQDRNQIREFLEEHGIRIETDIDGRWESVEIVLDDEELTLFLLRWS